MKTYLLPKKTIWLWQIRITLISAFLILVFLWAPFNTVWTVFTCGLTFILFLFFAFWYMPKFIKSCKITIANDSVIIKRGVLIRNCHILPFSRLIHTQSVATPLARLFRLETVLLKAARFRIFVPELSRDDAESLVKELSAEDSI